MAVELLPDELWNEFKPLLPEHPPNPKGGLPWADDRNCLRALIFIMRTGIPYQMLPREVFGVSGSTSGRRSSSMKPGSSSNGRSRGVRGR